MTTSDVDIDFEALNALREQLDRVDAQLIETIAQRQTLVRQIGEIKAAEGHQTRDFRREKIVLDKARAAAEDHAIDPDLATRVLKTVIRASLEDQERARVRGSASGSGRRALVIGGAGRMGQWFVEYFHSQGFAVDIVDPAADQDRSNAFATLDQSGCSHDVIVVAATLNVSADILQTLSELKPAGLVFDVGSLKSPLTEPLGALVEAGVRATSLHPMFGPSVRLLAGRHMIFCDVGDAAATAEAKALFSDTMVECVDMSLAEHDELIAFVLGLSHLLNITFADTLSNSGVAAQTLAMISSPTFDAQLAISHGVVEENPDLYFEIQRLNEFRDKPLSGLQSSVDRLKNAVSSGDVERFRGAMLDARDYLSGLPRFDRRR